MGDFRFKVIDFDNACEIGENHPGGFSRGYVSPEVFFASQRRNNATSKSLDIKAMKQPAPVFGYYIDIYIVVKYGCGGLQYKAF
jgi:hypothetical protein